MIKKPLTKRSGRNRSKNGFLFFRLTVGLVVVVVAVFGLLNKNTLAQSWSEPAGDPPTNNAPGPVWNQNASAQTGNLWLSGNGTFGGTVDASTYCISGENCITSWPSGSGGGGGFNIYIKFTNTIYNTNVSDPPPDNACSSEFGSNWSEANMEELGANWKSLILPSGEVYAKGWYSFSGNWNNFSATPTPYPHTNLQGKVACISNVALFRETTAVFEVHPPYPAENVPVPSNACSSEFGSSYANVTDPSIILTNWGLPLNNSGSQRYFWIDTGDQFYFYLGILYRDPYPADSEGQYYPIMCFNSSSGSGGGGGGSGDSFWTASGNDIYNNNIGKVGIGTPTPNNLLQVAGLIDFDPINYNTFLGESIGSVNTTGSNNTATGRLALYANTTGTSNAAYGNGALAMNDVGDANTAIGDIALYFNTSGVANTASGESALYFNSTGSYNTAYGGGALGYNTTGDNNTAVGFNSGSSHDVNLLTMSNSTFLGYGANSSVDGITNSMALGNGAQVTASNQVVIGNGSVTATLLNGNVGIGTTSPQAKLDIYETGTVNQQLILRNNGTYSTGIVGGSSANPVSGDANAWGLFGGPNAYLTRLVGRVAFVLPTGVPDFSIVTGSTDLNSSNGTAKFTVLQNGNVGIGTTTPGSAMDVNGTLRLSGSGSGYVGFAPAAAAGSTTYTLPSADGTSGYQLTTNGSGTLSWAAAGSGGSGTVTTSGSPTQNYLAKFSSATAITNSLVYDTGTYVGVNQASPGSTLDVKGTLRLSGSSSGYVGFAPAAAAGSTTYTLPAADATTSGYQLTSNAAGTLSWALPAPAINTTSFSPSNPTGTTSTTGLMMGLSSGATKITPTSSGKYLITVTGMIGNSTLADGASVQLRYGSGNGPANAAALTGTTVGVLKNMIASTAAGKQGFALTGLVTGLTVGTGYYIDVGLKAVTGGTATIYDLDVTAIEL